MTIFEQITNSIKSTDGVLYQVSKEDYNQIRDDYTYDEQRMLIHPMHQFYIDNYGRQFNYEKYIECVLNYQLNKDYEYKVIINDQLKDPTIIKVFIVNRQCTLLHQPTVIVCLHPFNEVVSGDDGDFCCKCQTYLKSNKL